MLAYLSRYTQRVAIANSRLTRLADGEVDFSWKDYRHHGKTKTMKLSVDEFIRRFLLHTVPHGFHPIRHVGFLADGHRIAKLALCRAVLAVPPPQPSPRQGLLERYQQLTSEALDVCPERGGPMLERGPLPRRPSRPRSPFWCDCLCPKTPRSRGTNWTGQPIATSVRASARQGRHVRNRLIDLCQWMWEEFRISIAKPTLSRELRALGYCKFTARPRHHAQADGAIEALKNFPRVPGRDRAQARHRS